MESDSFALRTGLFIVGAGLVLVLTLGLFRDTRDTTLPYLVYTTDSVSGLDEQSRVYYKGVEVGFVQEIGFAEGDYDTVKIRIQIDESIPLGEKTYAQLSLRGITGEYDLVLDNEDGLGKPLETSEELPATIPMRSQFIARLGDTMEQILDEISNLSRSLQKLVSEENQARIEQLLDRAAEASERFVELEGRALEVLADVRPAIETFSVSMDSVKDAAEAVTTRTEGLDELIASIDRATNTLDQLLASFQGGTLVSVEETLFAMRDALRELNDLAEFLRRDPQSLLLGTPEPELGPGEQPESH